MVTKEDKEKHFFGQVTQKALIQRDGRILLAKYSMNGNRAAGMYDLPGGRLHEGETPIEGLKREVFEEIGVKINIGNIIATGTLTNMSNFRSYFVIYQASLTDPTQRFTLEEEEVGEVTWCDSNNFFTLPILYPEYQEALKNFLI